MGAGQGTTELTIAAAAAAGVVAAAAAGIAAATVLARTVVSPARVGLLRRAALLWRSLTGVATT